LYPSATAALPDYIMIQFRTISIIKPDLHLALEVMLCSQGNWLEHSLKKYIFIS
jgi:hypothetical protein